VKLPSLHNSLSARQPGVQDNPLATVLYDRLLWLRNHYDIGDKTVKDRVLADIDEVLKLVEEK
jgi:hypothetical protein